MGAHFEALILRGRSHGILEFQVHSSWNQSYLCSSVPCTTQHKNIEVQEIIPLELTLVVWGDFDENPPTVDIASPQLKNESNDKDNTMKPEDFGKLFS